MNMFAETPRRLLLTGALNAGELRNLTDYCRQLHMTGQVDLHLDLSAVTDCSRGALDGLVALVEGGSGLSVDVDGVRWNQFGSLLTDTPTEDVAMVCDEVRKLLAGPIPRQRRPSRDRRGSVRH